MKDGIVFTSVYIRLLKMLSISGKTLMSGRKLDRSKENRSKVHFLSLQGLQSESLSR